MRPNRSTFERTSGGASGAACCDNCGEVVVHPALRPEMPDDDESIFAAAWDVPALESFQDGEVLCARCA